MNNETEKFNKNDEIIKLYDKLMSGSVLPETALAALNILIQVTTGDES